MARAFEKWHKLVFAKKLTWSKRVLFWRSINKYVFETELISPWQFASMNRHNRLAWRKTESRGWELFADNGFGDLFNDKGYMPR